PPPRPSDRGGRRAGKASTGSAFASVGALFRTQTRNDVLGPFLAERRRVGGDAIGRRRRRCRGRNSARATPSLRYDRGSGGGVVLRTPRVAPYGGNDIFPLFKQFF